MNPLLEITDLTVSFQSSREKIYALQDISFHMDSSEIVAVVGESGCGKSTLGKALVGLLPPTGKVLSGSAYFGQKDLLHLDKSKMRTIRGKEIGMIFQDPFLSLNPTMKIGYQIAEVLLEHKICPKDEIKMRVLSILHDVNIKQPEICYGLYPHQLSGGMKQRVLIAIAIACNAKFLIADEPTTALDATIQLQILKLLKKIQKQKEMSILVITHNMSVVSYLCDRVIVMYAGQIIESGKVQDVLYTPKHPYTKMLLASVPTLDKHKYLNPLQPIDGSLPVISSPVKKCSFAPRCPHAMHICIQKKPPIFKPNVKCWLYDEKFTTRPSPTGKESEEVFSKR